MAGTVAALGLAAACRAPHAGHAGASLQGLDSAPKSTAPVAPSTDPLRPRVIIETTLGEIIAELDGDKAPATALHFLRCAESGYYDGTIFHRVLEGSMIQGGQFTPDMEAGPGEVSRDVEINWLGTLPSKRGTIGLVRPRDLPPVGAAEFFINVTDNPELDGTETRALFNVFGRVVEGMDTVERINLVSVGIHAKYANGQSAVVPLEPVVIRSIRPLVSVDFERLVALATAASKRADSRLAGLRAQLETQTGRSWVISESGLQYIDLLIGPGPPPLLSGSVNIQYRGTLVDGTTFEDTFQSGPLTREMSKLIVGLREGVLTMNEGGRRTMIIPPELGFGAFGVPGRIPSDATIIFDLELLEVK